MNKQEELIALGNTQLCEIRHVLIGTLKQVPLEEGRISDVVELGHMVKDVDDAISVIERRILAAAEAEERRRKVAQQCAQVIVDFSSRNYRKSRCKFKGKVFENNAWYCGIHSQRGKDERLERERVKMKERADRENYARTREYFNRNAGDILVALVREYEKLTTNLRRTKKESPKLYEAIEILKRYGRYREPQ